MKDRGEFSVYQFFLDDKYERVLDFVDAETAVKKAKSLSQSVGAKLGMTVRIIITDGGDHTVFEWKRGEGVTFPTEAMRKQA
jgi:hypothetical protein